MENEEKKYWLAFSHIPQIGGRRLIQIRQNFSSLKKAWLAGAEEIKKIPLPENVKETIILQRPQINPDKLLDETEKHQLQIICFNEEHYPPLLKEIYDPPALLYLRGQLDALSPKMALVGTRKMSDYGRQVVKDIIPSLIAQGLTTVSGLALGVDALVHDITVQNQGLTIAVLGGGLDKNNLYPSSNRYLADKIVSQHGALLSEYPPGTLPLKQHFPRRNRIISGLTKGVIIIEAGPSSGSLITAQLALEQNREVMAVPGSIYVPSSQGTNQLISQGAQLVRSAADIFSCMEMEEIKTASRPRPSATPIQEKILALLKKEPLEIDQLIRQSGLSAGEIASQLNLMELNGLVRKISSQLYQAG